MFTGKVVWVTGASSGIGQAMARDFLRKGAKVILTARREDRLNEIKLSAPRPEDVCVLPADLANLDALPELYERAKALFGRIDVLFNNAGVSQRSLALETKFSVEKKLIELDLLSPIYLTKLVLPEMVARGQGRIIVTSSLMGYLEIAGNTTYAAVKHGLNGYFYSLMYELEPKGIQVQVIEPGFVRTELTYHALKPDGTEYGKMDRTHERAMTPEQFSKKAMRALEKGKSEIIIGGWEVAALYVRWHCPRLYRFVMRKISHLIIKPRY